MRVRVGSACRPAVGQTISGDASEIVASAARTVLCLADGLGHGPEARAAADVACSFARAHAGEPLEAMLRGMDAALAGTRGAAVSVLALEPAAGRAWFAGVGNVDLRAITRDRMAAPTVPGIVGRGARRVRVWDYPLAAGDLIVLFSDGISSRFELEPFAHLEPQALANALVAAHHKSHDDGSCLVAKVEP